MQTRPTPIYSHTFLYGAPNINKTPSARAYGKGDETCLLWPLVRRWHSEGESAFAQNQSLFTGAPGSVLVIWKEIKETRWDLEVRILKQRGSTSFPFNQASSLESFICCFVYIFLILYKNDRMSRRIYNNTIFFISLQRLGNFWSMWHSHSFRVKQHLAAFIKWLNILNSSCLYLHRPSRLILLSSLSKPVSIRICHPCLHLWVINRHVKMQNNWCSLGGIGWPIWGF